MVIVSCGSMFRDRLLASGSGTVIFFPGRKSFHGRELSHLQSKLRRMLSEPAL